jgi:hypothetical protein
MSETDNTRADRELIEHAARFGFKVTARMLQDWRRAGAMPARIRFNLGRDGTRYDDPPEAKELLIPICLFLKKKGQFADRPDLPRRRKLEDALIWLWYEGIPVPLDAIREPVLGYWAELHEEFAVLAERARENEPDAMAYEVPVAVADTLAEQLAKHDGARRHLAVFARHRDDLDADPRVALRAAYSQLFQAMQGETSVELKTFGYLLEYMFIDSGLEDQPGVDPDAIAQVLDALNPSNVVRAVWNLTPEGWRDVRTFLHISQGMLISLERHNGDPRLRRMAKVSPKVSKRGELLMQVGFVAAMLPSIIEAVERRVDEPNEEWATQTPIRSVA